MSKEGHHDYFLRNVEEGMWNRAGARAKLEGKDIREVMIEGLKAYADGLEDVLKGSSSYQKTKKGEKRIPK